MRSAAKRLRVFGVVLFALLCIGLCAADEADDANAEKYNLPTFTLRVQDANGTPIQNFDYMRNGGRVTEVQRLATGELPEVYSVSVSSGVARVVNYNTGNEVTLFVGAPGYVTKPTLIPFDPPPTEVVVTLERAATVRGKIVDSLGWPVAGVRVWLGNIPLAEHHGMRGHIMESDAHGMVSSDRIPVGKVSFAILHPDFMGAVYEREVAGNHVNKLSFTLNSGASLTGTVHFGKERPSSAFIQITPIDPKIRTNGKHVECEQGNFVMKGITPGPNMVYFRTSHPQTGFPNAGWSLAEEINFAEREVKRIEKTIPTGTSSISGKVLVDGALLKDGVSIYLMRGVPGPGPFLEVSSAPSDQGDYVIGSLPSGSWRMNAQAWDRQTNKSYRLDKQISLADGEALRLDIDLPEAKLQ